MKRRGSSSASARQTRAPARRASLAGASETAATCQNLTERPASGTQPPRCGEVVKHFISKYVSYHEPAEPRETVHP